MNRKFIAVTLGTLTALSLSFFEANLCQAQTVENTVNYAQMELEENSKELNWEELWEEINSLPLFRYTTGITLILFLIFVFAIWREKEFKVNPITMKQERVNLISYFNNLLSSIAKKEPWEIFEKIFVPIFIGLIASFIAYDLEQLEEKIADKRFHEQIFANYMKEIREIMLEQEKINVEIKKINLNHTDEDNQELFNGLIQANTWNLALRLEDDAKLKGLLLRFLYDTKLIQCKTETDKLDCQKTIILKDINIEKADLTGADLIKANLRNVNLSHAKLLGADLRRASLNEVDLSSARLNNAKLSQTNLINANLINANLTKANLTNADLYNANLTKANLTNANLTNADLTNADLTNANLTKANLTNANLTNANLTNAKLPKSATVCNTTMPNQQINNQNCPDN